MAVAVTERVWRASTPASIERDLSAVVARPWRQGKNRARHHGEPGHRPRGADRAASRRGDRCGRLAAPVAGADHRSRLVQRGSRRNHQRARRRRHVRRDGRQIRHRADRRAVGLPGRIAAVPHPASGARRAPDFRVVGRRSGPRSAARVDRRDGSAVRVRQPPVVRRAQRRAHARTVGAPGSRRRQLAAAGADPARRHPGGWHREHANGARPTCGSRIDARTARSRGCSPGGWRHGSPGRTARCR